MKQGDPKISLQLPDLLADRCRSHMKLFRSLRKT